MTGSANVNLSDNELKLVTSTDWILTKHRIIQKVYDLFGSLSNVQQQKDFLPVEVAAIPPKIYKGEQYLQLPYVMMDNPRFFKGNDAFAIRHFFWWGNYFSITLQLSGKYKQQYETALALGYNRLAADNWFVCINNTPWQHHFETDNYRLVKDMGEEGWVNQARSSSFIKVAKKIPLSEWDQSYHFFQENFRFLQILLQAMQ